MSKVRVIVLCTVFEHAKAHCSEKGGGKQGGGRGEGRGEIRGREGGEAYPPVHTLKYRWAVGKGR